MSEKYLIQIVQVVKSIASSKDEAELKALDFLIRRNLGLRRQIKQKANEKAGAG